jgi:hypothetical protein
MFPKAPLGDFLQKILPKCVEKNGKHQLKFFYVIKLILSLRINTSTNLINKIQFMTSIERLDVSALGYPSSGSFSYEDTPFQHANLGSPYSLLE